MHKKKKLLTWALVISMIFGVGFVTDIKDNYFEISKNLDIFGKLYREINSLYVDDTDPSELMRVGIDAMLNSLDPYTNYISEEEVDEYRFMSTGQYGGIGALVGKREEQFVVLEPYENYPAQVAGLRAGDVLKSIDGQDINGTDMEVSDVRGLLRGEKGKPVVLEVIREGETQPLRMEMTRDRIKVDNVPFYGMVNDKVGYISLTGFTQDAGKEVQEASLALVKQNPGLQGIILDLRNNPGGRLDEAVNVANVFLPQNEVIVETRGRLEESFQVHRTRRVPVDTEIPLAVLVNGGSASASEIVAGSIQDLDRGVVVGQQSFGKGLVQKIRPLSFNTQLKVTTAKYYTPSGRCIQAIRYTHKQANGGRVRIPDSLRNEFKTKNGRTVYDGGGIQPDFSVSQNQFQTVTQELADQGLIFDFATRFFSQNQSIVAAQEFQIDESTYQEFKAFVREKGFDFETDADRQLEFLAKVVNEEAYESYLSEDLQALDRKLESLKDKDLDHHKAEIKRLLRQEIISRYYFRKGTIEASFADDEDILKAVKVLSDQELYETTLQENAN